MSGAGDVGALGKPGIAACVVGGAVGGAAGASGLAGAAAATDASPGAACGFRLTSGAGGRSWIQKYTTVPSANTPSAPIAMKNGRRGLGSLNLASNTLRAEARSADWAAARAADGAAAWASVCGGGRSSARASVGST